MTSVSIIGRGKMGSAIADVAKRAGARIQIITRDRGRGSSADRTDAEYAVLGEELTGEIIVLAVPYSAYPSIIEHYSDRLAGKVVVDIANAIDFSTYEELKVAPDSSTAAELAKQLPADIPVVKAFNVNLGDTLSAGNNGTTTTTVLYAGDDAEGKAKVAKFVEAAGMRAVDAGPLPRARELEAMGFLQIVLAATGATRNESGFTLLP